MEGTLIAGLPNDVSLQILARVSRQFYSETISDVCSSWREAATSPELFTLRKQLGVIESWSYIAVEYPSPMRWFAKKTTAGDSECCESKSYYCTRFAATNKVSVFKAQTNEWSRVKGMKDARARFGCGVVDGKVYVAGGYRFICTGDDSDGDDFYMYQYRREFYQASAEVYNPLTDEWTPMADMMRINNFIDASFIQGKFVVRGYFEEDEIVQAFHAEENRWVKFRSVEEDEMKNDDSSSSMNIYKLSDDNIDLFYKSTAIEGIDEDGEKCDVRGEPTACVVI